MLFEDFIFTPIKTFKSKTMRIDTMLKSIEKHDIYNYIENKTYIENKEIVKKFKQRMLEHEVFKNPILKFEKFIDNLSLSVISEIHYNYEHAIVEIFTDALLAAALTSNQLEFKYRLPKGAKIIPRLLISPNFIDEFGIEIIENKLIGSVGKAHYPLFQKILMDFQEKNKEQCIFAKELRCFLEKNYNQYHLIISLLAIAEIQVIHFTPVLEKMLKMISNENYDYYTVHGINSEEFASAHDDEHEEYLWVCLALVINKVNLEELEEVISQYLSLWDKFWLFQLEKLKIN